MKFFREKYRQLKEFFQNKFLFESKPPQRRYKKLTRNLIFIMFSMAVTPMIIMAIINYHQYRTSISAETVKPILNLITNIKHSLDIFLAERKSSLNIIANSYNFNELNNQGKLLRIFEILRNEFKEFVDIGIIDSSGIQNTYIGPYNLKNKNYKEQSWFKEVLIQGEYISEVFLGFRQLPHFIIAIKKNLPDGNFWIIRATIDTAKFNRLITSMKIEKNSDLFLINKDGVLQTPSRYNGDTLEKCLCNLPRLPLTSSAMVQDIENADGEHIFFSHIYLDIKPLILVFIKKHNKITDTWLTVKNELFWLILFSCIIVYIVTYGIIKNVVKQLRDSDNRRGIALRQAENTNKLASIGRFAANVSHEINNPLAIINENAGLIRDIVEAGENYPDREKFIKLTGLIHNSVIRAKTITHQLLSFAKRMEVNLEKVDMPELINEVLGFLKHEDHHKNIKTEIKSQTDVSEIISDKGQLQQVFLNIINNAYDAMGEEGSINIVISNKDKNNIQVIIEDNGPGISKENLPHIFEPFFTTKKSHGTGLGLAITYGIIKKLGGNISVHSEEDVGTTFTIVIPRQNQ